MTKAQKYSIGAASIILLLFSCKAFAKKPKPTKKGKIILDDPTGGFLLPAEVTTKTNTRLRSKPSTNSDIVYTYPTPTKLLVKGDSIEDDGQWFEVYDARNRTGWVRSDVVDYKITETEDCPPWYGLNLCP